jgi:tetratricopeptide (TPR) repeat protein
MSMVIIRFLKAHWFIFGLGFLFILPWIVFGHSLWQDFAAIDDGFLIVNNPIVHRLDAWHIKLAFTTFDPELYIPLTLLSFQLNWLLGGGSPFIFHLTNILLQSINALLVCALFYSWTKRRSLALVAALFFAVHPINTEAVVWAAGRKDLLCTMFFLLSYLGFRKFEESRRILPLALSICGFVLALLSKAMAATLPVVLLLDILLLRKERAAKSVFAALIPFAALAVLFLWIASFGKEHILASSSLWDTFVMAQKSSVFYLQKLLIPTGLTVIYPYQGAISLKLLTFLIPLLINVALAGVVIWQWKKRPIISFGILFYFITLAPTLFNFHKGDLLFFAVDRYAYLPGLGFLIVVLALGYEFLSWMKLPAVWYWLLPPIVILAFGIGSIFQTHVWDTPDSLFGRSLALYPESVSARMAMGSILRERNQLPEAFTVLHDGARYSDHPGLNIEAGLVYSANGQMDDAREQFRMALSKDPTLAPAEYYLGFLDAHDGNEASAISWYKKAIGHDPSYVTVRVHLAELLMKNKNFAEAEDQLNEALKWNPVSVEALQAMVELKKLQKNSADLIYWQSVLKKAEE